MKGHSIPKLVVAIAVSHLAGFIGSVFTYPAIPTWYAALNKPLLTPPGWLIGSVWLALYTIMGIAAWIIWEKDGTRIFVFHFRNRKVEKALELFGIQLALNALWSFIFFGLQQPGAAFVEIVILWFAILFTLIRFYKLDKGAGVLMLPYLLWVCFAANLNLMIWLLNI